MTVINKAYQFAIRKHKGQYRKDEKTPFFTHPKTVSIILSALMASDANLVAAGLLHDTIEDCAVAYDELRREFNTDIADLVREVTKDGYNKFPYLKTRRGVVLKFADRLANLCDMDGMDEKWQERYIEKSRFWEK